MEIRTAGQPGCRDTDAGGLGSNQSGMRAHNERLVLTILRRSGPMAKSEIARATGLSAQTVSVIMRGLEQDGILTRGEPVRGRVGQPSVPMRLARDGAFFLGLKVGRRSAEMVLTDFMGRVKSRALRLHDYPLPDTTVQFALSQIRATLDGLSPDERDRVAGLGIAMPFFLWNWARHLNVPEDAMAAWKQADIRDSIARHTALPVYLENDASAACGAEIVFGPYDGAQDFLYFYVGYFIGGGIVLDGKLFTGRGNAGALGPIPVPDGAGGVCQLLDVASLSVLEARLQAAGHGTAEMWESTENWAFDAAIVTAWIERAAEALAHAILSACSVLDFAAVRIDGWIPEAVRARLVSCTEAALQRADLSGIVVPSIRPGAVGPDARALGAASLPLSERFLVA